jgi:hypothetical protein
MTGKSFTASGRVPKTVAIEMLEFFIAKPGERAAEFCCST